MNNDEEVLRQSYSKLMRHAIAICAVDHSIFIPGKQAKQIVFQNPLES